MCVRASLASMGEASPRVVDDGWGFVEVEGLGRFRDVKLWPGGGGAWDWQETWHGSPARHFMCRRD